MSYDFAFEKICSHEVLFERLDLDAFSKNTLRFIKQPSNSRVKVYIDDVEVPQGGLYSTPFMVFSEEPYRIIKNSNDLISFKYRDGVSRNIQLITGNSVRASDLAAYLSKQLPELNVTVKNKRVHLQDKTPVKGVSFSFPDPTFLDKTKSLPDTNRILGGYKRLGINPGRVYSGSMIFPGWKIIIDPNSFVDAKVVAFDSPVLNSEPVMRASYFVDAQNCRRCNGTKIEFDYTTINGEFETVRDTDLLAQEIDKFLFVKIRSHWKWPWLGSNLINRIGGKGTTAFGSIDTFISMDISKAFEIYKDIKTQQDSTVFQQVSDAEFPFDIDNISVQTFEDDPTVAIVEVSVISRSRDTVGLTRVVGNPNPVFLNGSNQNPFLLRG